MRTALGDAAVGAKADFDQHGVEYNRLDRLALTAVMETLESPTRAFTKDS
jgi:hypothetical protein